MEGLVGCTQLPHEATRTAHTTRKILMLQFSVRIKIRLYLYAVTRKILLQLYAVMRKILLRLYAVTRKILLQLYAVLRKTLLWLYAVTRQILLPLCAVTRKMLLRLYAMTRKILLPLHAVTRKILLYLYGVTRKILGARWTRRSMRRSSCVEMHAASHESHTATSARGLYADRILNSPSLLALPPEGLLPTVRHITRSHVLQTRSPSSLSLLPCFAPTGCSSIFPQS
jgi:hypothetical protein